MMVSDMSIKFNKWSVKDIEFIFRKIDELTDKYTFNKIKDDDLIFEYYGKRDFEEELNIFIDELNEFTDNNYRLHFSYNIVNNNEVLLFPDYMNDSYIGYLFE